MSMSWLRNQMAALQAAYAADRMPHALLIHEAPGAGGEWLAGWVAQLVLCAHPERAPCLACGACQRVRARHHPDLISLEPVEDSRQIRIEQVRELAQELALTSHQGGYKLAIVSPADLLNRFAANALLKTLEEPPARTVLILVATQPSRLPATLLSRCQRIQVPAPARAEAIGWLEATRGKADWNAVLDVLGEAPWHAAAADPAVIVQISGEVQRSLDEAVRGALDPAATAERWARTELPLRLRCFENWLTKRIQEQSGTTGGFTEVGAVPYLQGAGTVLNIRALFGLLDGVRDLRSALETPINRGLALEDLLRHLAPKIENTAVSRAR